MSTININFKEKSNSYNASFSHTNKFNIEKQKKDNYYPMYKGEYIVTPLAFEETILDTGNKVLKEDVRVLEIPYFETSNLKGTTVYIANQI